MDEERKSLLRAALLKKRDEYLERSRVHSSETENSDRSDILDRAASNHDASVSEGIARNYHNTVLKIDMALRKLENDSYGICEECGYEIDVRRLEALPFAVKCKECQEFDEKIAKTKLWR